MTKNFHYKTIKKILPALCLAILVWVGMGGVAHAGVADWLGFGLENILLNPILQLVAFIAYISFTLSSWFLAMCGTLMNVGIQLTVHLGAFINSNKIIYTVWGTIRDLSSMLLIFFILWAAIQMILSLKRAAYGSLLKSIIIAGILINFSFFFSQVLIDASNIVSLQFFNAMAPKQDVTYLPTDKLGDVITKTIKNGSGGISGIFTGSLGVNQWWSNKSTFGDTVKGAGSDTKLLMGIIIANYTGALVQVLAGLSFLAAAIATLWRSIVLLLLLGFSPIWIAAYAMPQLKEFRDQWMGPFQSNLIFLPVYMALMYVAILIISNSDLNSLVKNISVTTGNSTEVYLQLFIAFAIIIILINIPLVAALKMSGLKLGVVDNLSKSMSNFLKWGTTGRLKAGGAWAGRNTLGATAYGLNRSGAMAKLATWSPTAGIIASRGLSKVGSAGFGGKKGGYEGVLKQEKKDIDTMHERIGESIKRSDYETDEEYNDAKKAAQAAFRSNLTSPNLSLLSEKNVLNKLMASRGMREAAVKLNKEAGKQNDKDEARKARNAMGDVNKTILALRDEEGTSDAELKSLLTKIGESEKVNAARKALGLESITASAEQRVAEIQGNQQKRKEQIKELQKVVQELTKTIRKGEDVEKEEGNQKIMKELEKLTNKSESGGSSKPNKEEEKKTT